MKRTLAAACLLASVLILSCTDSGSPSRIDSGMGTISMAVSPVFPTGAESSDVADISRIRITVLRLSDRAVVDLHVEDVDPGASQWTLGLDIPVPEGDARVVLVIELISVTDGRETVEWSGETAPITLVPGQATASQEVEVVRGPVGNLAVTSVSILDPGPLVEGTGAQLVADVQTDRAGAQPVLAWASSNAGVATVSESGFLTAILPGTTLGSAVAGAADDEIAVVVVAHPVGLSFVQQPGEVLVGEALAPAPSVEVIDARGDRDATFSGQVTVALQDGAAATDGVATLAPATAPEAGLTGTISVTAVGGLAVFSDLVVDGGGVYRLGATATGLTPASSQDFQVLLPVADIVVSKAVDLTEAFEGDDVVFTVTVVNNGPAEATGVVVSDALPAGLTLVSATPSVGAYSVASGSWDVGTLANGATATLTITATVAPGTGGQTLVNVASAPTLVDQSDDDSNNAASASVVVSKRIADIEIRKEADRSEVAEGEHVVFTISLTNLGPDRADNIVVAEHLPAGLGIVAAEAEGGGFDHGSGAWSVSSLVPGSLTRLRITAVAQPGTGGQTLTNLVVARTLEHQEDDPSNNEATASVSVIAASTSSHKVYVSNTDDDNITFIDLKAGTAVAYDCGGLGSCDNPRNLAANHAGTLVAVPFRHSDEVGLFDPSIPGFVAVLSDASLDEPYAVAFTADDKELWVANKKGGGSGCCGDPGSVSIVSLATSMVVAVMPDAEIASPEGLHIAAGKAFVVNRGDGTVTIVSVAGRSILFNVSVGGAPRDAVGTPDGQWVYVTSDSGYITKIKVSDGSTSTISVTGSSRNIAISPDGKRIFVATFNNRISVVDVATDAVREITLTGASDTYGVTILQDGSLGFASDNNFTGKVLLFDANTEMEIVGGMFPLTVGRYPRGITSH